MGLIIEPKEIDFYVIDKSWTEEEKLEFSELIKKQKENLHKRPQRIYKKKIEKHTACEADGNE